MRTVVVIPGGPLPAPAASLAGAVLPRDVIVAGVRWSKGRCLSGADVAALGNGPVVTAGGEGVGEVALLLPGEGEVHEDEAARRLAAAAAGPGLGRRGPLESRVDLVAEVAGVARVRTGLLAQIDAIDGVSVFTVLDGQAVEPGDLVASAKSGPHLVAEASIAAVEALVRVSAAGGPVVEVRPYRRLRFGAVVKEALAPPARARFEATLAARVAALGSDLVGVRYVPDDAAAIAGAFRALGPDVADIVLTAGGSSTDPTDAIFEAFAAAGGSIVSHGVPAHPGSMLWLGVAHGVTVLGLPTCGAYSRATAADLLLPWLVAGEPPTRALVARLGHGGVLSRGMRFRFPAYAREYDAPEG